MRRFELTLVLLSALILANCGGADGPREIDRASAALTTTTNVKAALVGAADALALLEDSVLLERLADAFGGGGMVCASVVDDQGDPTEAECYEEPADLDLGLAATGDKLATWLEAAVFDPAQVEEEDGDSLTILLAPAIFCQAPWAHGGGDDVGDAPRPMAARGAGGGDSGSPEYYGPDLLDDGTGDDGTDDEVDDGCADFLTRVPMRLRFVATADDEVHVDVLFGDLRVDPFDVTVGPDTLAVEVDLGLAKQAWQVVSDAFAPDGEVIEVPQVVEGAVKLELVRHDDAWTFTGAVTEPVTLDKDLNGQHPRLTVAPSQVSLTAAADGTVATLSSTVGAVALSIPYQWVVDSWSEDDTEPPQVAGNLDFALPAWTATVSFDDATQALSLHDVGLPGGPFAVSRDGALLASLVLNADVDGVVNALVDLSEQNVRVTVEPLFDLAADLHLAPLAADLPDLPSFANDETLRVRFDQALAPTFVILDGGIDEALSVTDGTLVLSSTAAPDQTVTVPAGQCLTFADDDADAEGASEAAPSAEHEILSSLVSGTCP